MSVTLRALCLAALVTLLPAAATAQPNCGDPPDALIVLDHSGSMGSTSGGQTKWAHAKTAVTNMVTTYSGQIRFGLMLFPKHPNGASCDGGVVNVPVGNNTAAPIGATLATAYPTGSTPIAVSLKSAHAYLQGVDPAKKKYVVLITDGQETCGGKPVDWVTALMGLNIKTYVVGFGSGVDASELNSLAQAGGTALPAATKYYQADSPTQLNQALQSIGSLVSCCGNAVLDSGEKCDKAIPTGQAGACPTPAACNDNNACTLDGVSGKDCSVVCSHTPVTQPKSGDGCCPPGATSANDSDCAPACGNGVLESGEQCDPGINSGPGACKTLADCDDGAVCTADSLSGSACNVQCKHVQVTADPVTKDGCCLPGDSLTEDADCPPKCNPDSTGNCVNQCEGVNCPDGQYCVNGQCKPWPKGSQTDAGVGAQGSDGGAAAGPGVGSGSGDNWTEGTGCACRAAGGGAGLVLPLMVLLGLALLRRRS